MQYCLPEIPSTYWIDKTSYRCKPCGHVFNLYTPNGDGGNGDCGVVKFIESNGTEIRWLPMYGQGGYLDLFERFMPGFLASGKPLIPPVVSQFMEILQNYTERSEAGNSFEISHEKVKCPQCKKNDVEMLKETVLTSPDIAWLKIASDLMQK